MTRNEKIIEIIKSCTGEKTIENIFKATGISMATVRVYSNVMAEIGVLEKIMVSKSGRGIYAYKATDKKITNDLLADISIKICWYYKEKKLLANTSYLESKQDSAFKKEKQCKNEIEALNNQKLGIYLLSSKPSKHFIKQFEAQSKRMIKERKSPKAYAGTSAGMVW